MHDDKSALKIHLMLICNLSKSGAEAGPWGLTPSLPSP